MKKVIVGMLLLLPLIIVASVLFAIDVITVEAYIAVERIELNEHVLELMLSDVKYDGLKAQVYPSRAKTDIIWSISDVVSTAEVFEDSSIVDIDSQVGVLTLKSYGTFTVTATTTSGNKSDRCNVYIRGDKVESVSIRMPENKDTTLRVGERIWLDSIFYPIDAIVKTAYWTSSRPDIIRVDQNGIVTAVNVGGPVDISVLVNNEKTGTLSLSVSESQSKYGKTIYLGTNETTLSALGIAFDDIISYSPGVSVSQFSLEITANSTKLLTKKGEVDIYLCNENEIVVENADLLTSKELRVGKLPLMLRAIYKDSRRFNNDPQITNWISSDTTVATIGENGVVTPIANSSGVVFSAIKDNISVCSIEIVIVKPISIIVLDKSADADKHGIAAQNIYGNRRYGVNGIEADSVKVGIVFPVDVDTEKDLIFTVSNSSLATVDKSGLVTFIGDFSNVENNTLTVTVTAVISPYVSVPVKRSYSFKVFNGINCYTASDMRRAADDGYAIFMRNDISYVDGDSTIKLKNNLYGNGYVLNGIGYKNKPKETTSPSFKRFNMLQVVSSGVTVSNINIKSDDPENINQPNGLRGAVILIGDKTNPFIENVRVEYSILENGFYGVDGYNASYTIDGCIIRNISNFGLHIATEKTDSVEFFSTVTMNNCVFSNIVAPAVALTADSNNIINQSALTVNGFLDIYNWQPINSMRLLDRQLVENETFDSLLRTMVKNLLVSEFAKDKYAHIRKTIDDVSYVHLGIITAGALYEFNGSLLINDDERLHKFDIDVLHNGEILPIKLKPVILYNYLADSVIQPGDDHEENEELYKRLRGE
ncbi:MAG: Ig-like domain-containing protein [Christensenellaceae bacterium]|jgi:hypothetical protein|nr:Ig-like domain-containing protein [Christensenellaceae bacterium]